jgi:hypothetical protein
MPSFISSLINQGIPTETLSYLLFVPLLATLIVFLRQVIGFKSIGVYYPLLLTFAFIELGIEEGLIAFLLIVILANLITCLVKKISLLYLPRLTIVVSITTIFLIALIFLFQFLGYDFQLTKFLPLVIILSLSDKLVSVQIKKNFKSTLIMILSTLATAIMGFYLIQWKTLQLIILRYSLIYLFLILIINIFLGRFRGLRISELWRFRRLLKLPPKD